MLKTIYEVLQQSHSDSLERWDKWDYRIWAPLSFDDLAILRVVLIRQDKAEETIILPLK